MAQYHMCPRCSHPFWRVVRPCDGPSWSLGPGYPSKACGSFHPVPLCPFGDGATFTHLSSVSDCLSRALHSTHIHTLSLTADRGARVNTECRDPGPGPHSFNTAQQPPALSGSSERPEPGPCPESVYGKVVGTELHLQNG